MPVIYKIDILQALKDKGYNTNRLRKEKIFGENTIQQFREKKPFSLKTLGMLCQLLECDISDIIEYIPDGSSL